MKNDMPSGEMSLKMTILYKYMLQHNLTVADTAIYDVNNTHSMITYQMKIQIDEGKFLLIRWNL